MQRINRQGALRVAQDLDRLASLIQKEAKLLKIPSHIAADAVHKFDALADHIEKVAGINPQTKQALTGLDVYKEPGFDPENIGEEVGGPLEGDADEPYMKGEFTQQEKRELREKQQAGELAKGSPEPQAPRPGVQAAFKGLVTALKTKPMGKNAANIERALKLATQIVLAEDEDEVVEEEKVDEKTEGKK